MTDEELHTTYDRAYAAMLTCVPLKTHVEMKAELAHLRQENDRLRAQLARANVETRP